MAKRKRPKTEREKLITWLDNKYKIIGKDEDTYCEICGKSNRQYQIHGHHIVGRTHMATTWDMANRLWVCARCHTLDQKEGVEYNLGGWFFNRETDTDWLEKNRPKDKEYLLRNVGTTKKWTVLELELLKKRYQEAIKNPKLIGGLKYLLDQKEFKS